MNVTNRTETYADEIARLQREIAERQARLNFLLLGDQSKGVELAIPYFARLGYVPSGE